MTKRAAIVMKEIPNQAWFKLMAETRSGRMNSSTETTALSRMLPRPPADISAKVV